MDLCQCQNIEAMITKCPYCGNEYEIELDHSVGEITIRCPKCKVPFVINNQKDQKLKPVHIVANETVKPAKNTNSWQKWGLKLLNRTLEIVAVCIGVLLCILIIRLISVRIRDAKSEEGNDLYPKMENVKSDPTYQSPLAKPSQYGDEYEDRKQIVYKAGYNTGYTGGNEFDSKSTYYINSEGMYRSDEKEEWCRSLWGVFCSASGTDIDDESLYKEFRRGFIAGIEKRKSLMQKEF